ncbi:MAG: hypothetical protein V3T26_05915 [candidate division NC10 bacterium]
MTEIQVQIDAKAVEKAFVEAVLKAGIGARVEEAVNKALTIKAGYDSRTVLEGAMDAEVSRIAREEVRKQYEEAIIKRVRESFDKDKIMRIVDSIIEEIVGRILNKAMDR